MCIEHLCVAATGKQFGRLMCVHCQRIARGGACLHEGMGCWGVSTQAGGLLLRSKLLLRVAPGRH